MTYFVMVRHGRTEWNAAGRIQGHTDIPLCEEGRTQVSKQRIPCHYKNARWVSSPLVRAVQTAQLMGCSDPELERALMEMNWGEWEGLTLSELRERHRNAMRHNEDRGLDFRPTGGESPRDVQERVVEWMGKKVDASTPVVAVTHKGVIRATLSKATGWDMIGPPPLALDWTCAHVFSMDENKFLKLYMANVPL